MSIIFILRLHRVYGMLFILMQIFYILGSFVNGLDFEPKPNNPRVKMIYYKSSDNQNVLLWVNRLNTFLEPYTKPRTPADPFETCDHGIPPQAGSNIVCDVKVDEWYPCVPGSDYLFSSSQSGPCVFLKIDKIPGWVPEYYNVSTIPKHMPSYIKQHITFIQEKYGPDSHKLKVLWVSCEGADPVDKEFLGPLFYMPHFGFDGAYFPAVENQEYLSPLVAVVFENPTRGVLINVKCRVWARNINDKLLEDHFSTNVYFMVDDY